MNKKVDIIFNTQLGKYEYESTQVGNMFIKANILNYELNYNKNN
jgi:hypothetical protein